MKPAEIRQFIWKIWISQWEYIIPWELPGTRPLLRLMQSGIEMAYADYLEWAKKASMISCWLWKSVDSKHSIWNASKQPVMSNEGNPLCPRKQAVMSTGGKLLCPTGCERVSRQPSMSYRFRTFSTKKCVPSESRQPLEIKGSGGFQNGLMFQPHPESTSFTSMGSLVRVQLSPQKSPSNYGWVFSLLLCQPFCSLQFCILSGWSLCLLHRILGFVLCHFWIDNLINIQI